MVHSNSGKLILITSIFASLITFLVLGIVLKESIFFGYDMPRVALKVQEFLSQGSYMTSQYFYSESTWKNVAWGPAFMFFYGILLKLSPDPLPVSYMLTFLSAVGIAAATYLGWKYFSPIVGFIICILLCFNPYWFTYARIIYQPSPLTFFLPVSMLLYFGAINKKAIPAILLPIVWVIMLQIYIPAYAFIITSVIFILFYLDKKLLSYLLLGSILSLFFIIPSIKFYKEKPVFIERFIRAPSQFTPTDKTVGERIQKVLYSYINLPIGGMFEWQTGNSFDDFIIKYPNFYRFISPSLMVLLVLSHIWGLYFMVRHKDLKRAVIFFWAISSIWSLFLLHTSELPPRYYLISIPPALLLIALFFDDTAKIFRKIGIAKLFILTAPVLIGIYWLVFNVQYALFIKNYNFPYGWFRDVAETPYVYIKGAMDWVIGDSKINGCQPILSNDFDNPNFSLWMETEYVWKYVYKKNFSIPESKPKCLYLIIHKEIPENLNIAYKQFGPFAAFKTNLEGN